LCVAEDAEVLGPPWPTVKPTFAGEEDLVNAAAVLTIRAGGSVFAIPADRMGLFGPVAAILRY
jgi:hypothetical protein